MARGMNIVGWGVRCEACFSTSLISALVTEIQPAQVLGLKRLPPPRRRASAGFLRQAQE